MFPCMRYPYYYAYFVIVTILPGEIDSIILRHVACLPKCDINYVCLTTYLNFIYKYLEILILII